MYTHPRALQHKTHCTLYIMLVHVPQKFHTRPVSGTVD